MDAAVEQWVQEAEEVHGRRQRQTTTSSTTIVTTSSHQQLTEEPEIGIILHADNTGTSASIKEFLSSKDANVYVTSSLAVPPCKTLVEKQIVANIATSPTGTATEINESGTSSLIKESRSYDETDLYLDEVYNYNKKKEEAVAHEFYCPNCKSCIQKVIVREFETESAPLLRPDDDRFRCSSCFSFLNPAGKWFFPGPSDQAAADSELPPSTSITVIEDEETIIPSEVRDDKKLEIIKSIVYGGLTESITSLGVVTSAASAGASTLNIVALSLANIVGGFFVIGHNLRELKSEQSEGTSDQTNEQADRYKELLGNGQNFILHATVAILSFLVFGLVPPLVYGFSFRKSDDKDYKLAAVAAASLLCIILLAALKAYVNKPPKKYIRTLLYYVVIGFMTSGVSYLAGELIKKLIEKLRLFDSVAVHLAEMNSGRPAAAWTSY